MSKIEGKMLFSYNGSKLKNLIDSALLNLPNERDFVGRIVQFVKSSKAVFEHFDTDVRVLNGKDEEWLKSIEDKNKGVSVIPAVDFILNTRDYLKVLDAPI